MIAPARARKVVRVRSMGSVRQPSSISALAAKITRERERSVAWRARLSVVSIAEFSTRD